MGGLLFDDGLLNLPTLDTGMFIDGDVTIKRCRTCGDMKAIDEFYRQKRSGYIMLDCKACAKKDAAARQRRRRLENPKFPEIKNCANCNKTKPVAEFSPKSATVCHLCNLAIRSVADSANKIVRDGPRRHIKQDISSGFKVCKTCTERKPLDEFPKSLNAKTGVLHYKSDCKLCTNVRARFYGRDWTRKQQKLQRAKERRRRAAKRGAEGTHTPEDIDRIRKAQKDRCCMPWCRVKLKGKGNIEHRVPLWAGGTDDAKNLQLACGPCNSSKGTRDEIDFVQSRNAAIHTGQMRLL